VVTARQISEQFDVSLRTVYRDIKVLEESGIPIVSEAGQGYSLVDGFKLPPLMFSTEEAIAFLMAEKLISQQSEGDTYKLYQSGMNKIRAVLKSSEKNILDEFDNYLQVIETPCFPQSQPNYILQPLLKCIIEKRSACIEYYANYNRELSFRHIEPLGIYFMPNNWYLLAWCRLRHDYRTFSLSRIQKLIPCEIDFTQKHASLKDIMNSYADDGIEYHVKIKVKKSAIGSMGMTKYAFGLEKEKDLEDGIIQYYTTFSLEKLGRWYLSFADQATIMEPEEFKDTVKDLLSRIKI